MQSELEGIGKLRKGILILIIALIIFVGAVVSVDFISGATLTSTLSEIAYIPPFSKIDSASIILILASFIFYLIISPSFFTTIALINHAVLAITELVSIILSILGYLYLRRGFKTLMSFGKNVRTGDIGARLFFPFVVLLIVGAVLLAGISIVTINPFNLKSANDLFKAGYLGSTAIEGIGFLLLFISDLLLGIGFYQVGGTYNESVTKIGGIFTLTTGALGVLFLLVNSNVSVVTPFIYFISLVLLYVGLMRISPVKIAQQIQPVQQPLIPQTQPAPIRQPVVQQPPPLQQPPSIPQTLPAQNQPTPSPTTPQIYQVVQGVIKGDGSAFITLYTSTQAMITSVKVDGTTLNAVMVRPALLQPGQNTIVVKFDNVSQLIPGNSYVVTIGVKVGGNLTEVKAAANYYP